jgi:hypothetical protein
MSYLNFKGVDDYGDFTISDEIQYGTQTYFEWGFLSIGAFTNVRIPGSGQYTNNEHILRRVKNPTYSTGQVWEGFRNNWVWESGFTYGVQPIDISGIYINGTFQPSTGVGAYAFNIDYPNGNIVFNSPISVSSTVMCEYSYKRIKFANADSIEGRRLQQRTLQIDADFLPYSGNNTEFERNKLQLPAVLIETIPNKSFPKGTQLGGGRYLEQSLLMHVFAESPNERNKIIDIIVNQHDSNIVIYDMNKLAENDMYPLNLNGNIENQSTRNYNNLVGIGSQYGYRQGIFKKIESQEQNYIGNIFGGIAKVTLEIGIPNV